jgi:hypothetical protein
MVTLFAWRSYVGVFHLFVKDDAVISIVKAGFDPAIHRF